MPKKTVFDNTSIDCIGQPMFLGKPMGLHRFDRLQRPEFLELFKTQMNFFWRPERIDLTKDRPDFDRLSPQERRVFTLNLQYQTAMDTVITRGVDSLMPYVSLTEMEAAFNYWRFCENLHSYSYTYLLQNATPDAGKIFDDALVNPEIIKRGASVKAEFDRLLDFEGDDPRKQIMTTLFSTQILEGVRFYVSFACAFALAEPPRAKMEGNAKIVREICRDENVHVEITSSILNALRVDPREGFTDVWKECRPLAIEMFDVAAREEIEWAKYVFQEGPIANLNEEGMVGFIKFLTDLRMQKVGLPAIFGQKVNPLNWISKWFDGHMVQVAPQETEVESYRTGSAVPLGDLTDMVV